MKFETEQLASWCGGRWTSLPPHAPSSVQHDTRHLEPGCLYVALRGERLDGHDFVGDALDKGAAGVLVDEQGASMHADSLPMLVVPDTLDALQKIAAGYRATLDMQCVAVTGSVGKTAVKDMAAGILSAKGQTAATIGNWNNHIGLPLSLLNAPPDSAFGVFEVAMNQPGEIAALCQILKPSWGVMTTVGPAHLEGFESVEAIAREKAALLSSLPRGGTAIVSLDNPYFELFRKTVSSHLVTVSMNKEAEYHGTAVDNSTVLHVANCEGEHDYPMPLPGRYVMENALLAIALGREMGVSAKDIAKALKQYKPAAMRWAVETIQRVRFINDAYNANPVSMRAAVQTLSEEPADGAKWLVLGGMRELGKTSAGHHRALGHEVAAFHVTGLITVGDLAEEIFNGAREAGMTAHSLIHCDSAEEAANVLREHVKPGDEVLVKASRGEQLERVIQLFSSPTPDTRHPPALRSPKGEGGTP